MTIVEKLTIIKNSVQDIKNALANKGATYGDITTLASAIDNMQSGSTGISDDYTELQYLEKIVKDESYIDLGIKANKNTKIVLDFAISAWVANTNQGLFGYYGDSSQVSFGILFWNWTAAGTNKVSSAGALSEKNSGVLQYAPIQLNKKYTYTLDTNSYQVDDITEITYSNPKDILSPGNLYLFRVNSSNSTYSNATSCTYGKLYSLKIYENGELIHEYIPVQKKSTLEYGLCDKVTGYFLTPSITSSYTGVAVTN